MSDDKWIDRARQELDRSVRDLDGRSASRLNRARQTALAAHERRASARSTWAGALVALALVLLAGGLWLRSPNTPRAVPRADSEPVAEGTPLADLDVLSAEEDLEMLADLEFYLWLDGAWTEDAG